MDSRVNMKVWEDASHDERKIYHIYEEFQKRTNKMGNVMKWLPSINSKHHINFDKIRESKNWKYFSDVWEIFKDFPEFDEEIFMESVFRHVQKKIFPAQLRTKKIIENYKEYRMKLKMTDKISDEKIMMADIANTYKYIKRKIKKEKIKSSDIYYFFNYTKDNDVISDGLKSCILEMISPFYMVISKSFEIAYKNSDKDIQDEIIDMDRFNNLRSLVKIKTIVYSFAKKIFGDDII